MLRGATGETGERHPNARRETPDGRTKENELAFPATDRAFFRHIVGFIHQIGRILFRSGGFGLLTLSAFDSSPLVVPFGNDLLVMALSANHHVRMLYYAVMATVGSLVGCWVTDWLSRKSEKEQKKLVSRQKLDYIRSRVKKSGGWALAVASILPPPFPFTPFVAAAAAFDYPKNKLFTVVGVTRLMRFMIEGALAVHYGRWIIRQAESAWLERTMLVLIVISIGGSAVAIYKWVKSAGKAAPQEA